MRQAIIERISRRQFESEPLSAEMVANINAMVEKANQESGLSIELLEDGSGAFGSLRKSYGMFSGVRSMLLMKGKKTDEHMREKIGYYGERIVLDCTDLGLGCCWVGGTFDRDFFAISDDEEMACVILIGNVGKPSLKERAARALMSKRRKPVEDRLTSTAEVPQWITSAMEAVRLAPSAINKQKPHFNYDGVTLTASVPNDYVMDLIDLGIAKLHFEIEAGGKFEMGNGGKYNL